jgi:acetyl-CoA carboxylase biotin carboxylase subunit
MIRKVLVANRGEIACRIMRTCADMGIATVGVFSGVDANAAHVHAADEAVRLSGTDATAAYLDSEAVIAAARRVGADAVHPGYGFLAENAAFALACREAGLTFIGPEPEVIARMGSKREAKQLAVAAGVPVVPGYEGDDQSDEIFAKVAEEISYPVMVKASAGGGGKGMRLVEAADLLPAALAAARRESLAAFGDDTLMLEKVISEPRHIEFQIIGDTHGNIIHLGERECTIQRRFQKVIEETPSIALTPELRARMGAAAIAVGRQLGYTNAGTVEFILDADANFYFLEVNTRLQVEHPITELMTGLDLVRWQILVAEGAALPLDQGQITFSGHAVEARVYAEDPTHDFLPASGSVTLWVPPSGEAVRVDSGLRTGDIVSAYYDPLLAKVSAWGGERAEALRRLDLALAKTVLLGVPTNIAFLRNVLLHPAHLAGDLSTAFIERYRQSLLAVELVPGEQECAAIAVAVYRYLNSAPPRRWRNNPQAPPSEYFEPSRELRLQPSGVNRFEVQQRDGENQRAAAVIVHTRDEAGMAMEVDGHLIRAYVAEAAPGEWWVQINGRVQVLHYRSPMPEPVHLPQAYVAGNSAPNGPQTRQNGADGSDGSDGAVIAPMPGVVVSLLVQEGQSVLSGDPLFILGAMKMEHTVRSPRDGIVARIYYRPGEQVVAAAVLLELIQSGSLRT